jgi:hypothetical protein
MVDLPTGFPVISSMDAERKKEKARKVVVVVQILLIAQSSEKLGKSMLLIKSPRPRRCWGCSNKLSEKESIESL